MRWNCNWTLAIYALQGLVGSLAYYLLLQNIPGETLWICKKKKKVSNLDLLRHSGKQKKNLITILRTLIKSKFCVVIALCKTQGDNIITLSMIKTIMCSETSHFLSQEKLNLYVLLLSLIH